MELEILYLQFRELAILWLQFRELVVICLQSSDWLLVSCVRKGEFKWSPCLKSFMALAYRGSDPRPSYVRHPVPNPKNIILIVIQIKICLNDKCYVIL